MNIAIAGLWHLGTVTAACVAALGHTVTAYDDNTQVIDNFRKGLLPVAEPDLDLLVDQQARAGRLTFTNDPYRLSGNQVLWVCWDTPVDDADRADVDFVLDRVQAVLPRLDTGALVLISSQLPAGTTAQIEAEQRRLPAAKALAFAYSPENLRLGSAIHAFQNPDRIVVGIKTTEARVVVSQVFADLASRIEWMSVESAEMTKHALNAFLATSVSFINEIATLCESAGADAGDVARALKSDARIGPRAYLHPGSAFAGGTLARDVSFLLNLGKQSGKRTYLLKGVQDSNNNHKDWAHRSLSEALGNAAGKTVAVLGLTYKPGTNTLRRSSALELCRSLAKGGVTVRGYDPALTVLPEEAAAVVQLTTSAIEAITGADAVVISGAWPEFRTLTSSDFAQKMRRPVVLDPTRFLEQIIMNDSRIRYIAIGKAR